jgi:hypothetical protein
MIQRKSPMIGIDTKGKKKKLTQGGALDYCASTGCNYEGGQNPSYV